uniref:Uncharacterized protein n=1 Tax=Candidatus Methanophaga sp. ANME-1 ERB7 TaxID=2759913 RepID=A0A7G9Z1T6_9EURY|nr:hypothetical protein IIFEDBNN_00004 [Methanosarcinales archaeon ANME-1 ERB7]
MKSRMDVPNLVFLKRQEYGLLRNACLQDYFLVV